MSLGGQLVGGFRLPAPLAVPLKGTGNHQLIGPPSSQHIAAQSYITSRSPHFSCHATTGKEKIASPEEEQQPLQAPPDAVTPAWQYAIDLLQSGESFTTTIQAVNKSGVLVGVGKLSGFIPYKLMNRALLAAIDRRDWSRELVGRPMEVKVTQVVIPERRLICSQKAALLDKAAVQLPVGEVVSGTVTSLHSFGAFIELADPTDLEGTEVILPLREVSWDWISTVSAKLAKGDHLSVRVIDVRPPPRPKVVVSLKRMQEDPLKETLDKVLPLEGGIDWGSLGEVAANMPTGVEDILSELSKEPGVQEVTLGRRAEEKRTVSQDLELWISREAVADGFNLVARAGRILQEIRVATGMSAGEMRSAVQRVLKRVN